MFRKREAAKDGNTPAPKKKLDLKALILGSPGAAAETPGVRFPDATQGFIPIQDVQKGMILTLDGRYIKLLEILPTNFHLKSLMERQNIIYYFASWLRVAPSNLQIIVRTQKADIDAYCQNMAQYFEKEPNPRCQDMIMENAGLVDYLAENEAVTRRFFLAFSFESDMHTESSLDAIAEKLQEDAETAAQYLAYCGLEVLAHENQDQFTMEVLYSLLNKRSSSGMPLPDVNTLLQPVFGEEAYSAELEDGQVDGVPSRLDILAPGSADLRHKDFILVDSIYHSYLYISGYGYPTQEWLAWLSPFVEAGDGISLSFYLRRYRKESIVPKIAKKTMFNRSRMRDVDSTRSDFEEMDDAIGSGMYMKEEINRNGESFYYMETLIEVTADTEELLHRRMSQVETLCGAKGMLAKRADFKQAQAFQSFLPLVKLDGDIERKARRNVLTSGAAAAFPFSSFEICDQAGILLGMNLHNNSAVILDFFNAQKYSNANLSIMGMSGAGKTFLIQLLALRLRMQDIQVFILAPIKGFEFRLACEAVGGKYIKLSPGSTDCVNIMEIRRTTMDADAGKRGEARGDSVLADKIQKLHIFFSLLCPAMTPEERHLLDAVFIETYKRFGITHDNASLFENGKTLKTMPTLTDLYEILQEREDTHALALALSRFVNGSASALGGPTNVDLNNKYIVLDISEMGKDLLPLGMFLALDFVWDEAKKSRITKKMIFLDEIWEIVGVGSNPLAAEYALEIFKVIRGYGGGAVSATQDLVDYFALEDGKYGKAILNNCRTKVVLQLEESEAATVQKYLSLSEEETRQIVRSQRGQGLLCTGNSRISVEFRASQTEYDLITTSREDLIRQMEENT